MIKPKYLRYFLLSVIAGSNIFTISSQLYINEVLTSNISINIEPEYGNYVDWIEIYNAGDNEVDLIDYSITDNAGNPEKYKFIHTTYIGAHSYVLIWADEEDNWYHTNFSLDKDGEYIALVDPDGNIIDSITYKKQIPDVSYGRNTDGSNNWVYFSEPTPESTNNTTGLDNLAQAPKVDFSLSPGFYSSAQMVSMSSSTGTIHYTTDGSLPDENSLVYSSPINITSTTVLKARCYESGVLPGNIKTSTYLINESSDIPVVSISTDPYFLFDPMWGIYVEGVNGITGCDGVANFYQDWERPMNFEYFEIDGDRKVNELVGAKILGACSRKWPLKSLSLTAREKYGESEINYKFFSKKNASTFKSLNLRNSGNDFIETMLRDGFMQNVVIGKMDTDYDAYQPTVVFLNGEYWGILNLREKLNEHYVESNYGINSDEVSVLENNSSVVSGTADHYNNLLDYINSHDLSNQEYFDYVNTQMDVSEYLDYYLANTYFDNEDWPHNNNRYWRENNLTGRWRWMIYDLDFGFGLENYYDGNNLDDISDNYWSHDIISGLMNNENFRNEFIQRFAAHINTTFEPGRVIGILDSIASNIDSEIPRHIEKWGSPSDYAAWLGYIENMRNYAYARVPNMTNQILDYFGITGMYNLTTSVSVANSGKIKLYGVDITNATEEQYFDNIPIRLEAIPDDGYVFTGWTGDINSTTNPITLTYSSDVFIQANFTDDGIPEISNIFINEFAADETQITDDHGEVEDWIEIYNDNDFTVDIGGLYISDLISDPLRSQVPKGHPESTTIPAKGYLVLWADNEPLQGVLHLNIQLDKNGEELSLVQRSEGINTYLDSIRFNNQFINTTYGQYPEGTDTWHYLTPTPGSPNNLIYVPVTGIYINEFCASNVNILSDEFGEYDDWIEIYNSTDEPVNIGGLFMTDNLDNSSKYRISATYPDSTTIPAHGYILLWADDQEDQGVLHLGFKLSKSGEEIGLAVQQTDKIVYIDSLIYNFSIPDNMTYGRIPDGTGDWTILNSPTPDETNTISSIEDSYSTEYKLFQNSPNPFNRETKIKYSIPGNSQNAMINIYDMVGIKLLSIPLSNKGSGSITIYESELKAGIYIYTLTSDGQVIDSKRLILTK